MRAHELSGNMLCEYSWNDYVIFHGAPRDKVFLDSRFEMIYPRQIIDAYLAFVFGREGASRTLADFPNDFVLVDPETTAATVMANAPAWKLIYRDSDSLLYGRADSAASRIPGVPTIGTAGKQEFP